MRSVASSRSWAGTCRHPHRSPLWGDEDHVRHLFDGSGIELSFGPIVKARELLEPQGGWLPLRAELNHYFERETIRSEGQVVWPAEYLVVAGTKT